MQSSQKRLLVVVILISSRCVQSGGVCSDPIIELSSFRNVILQSTSHTRYLLYLFLSS
jgi:hypothetical protein